MANLYVRTVTDNITQFLKNKPHVARVAIENPEPGFSHMWDMIRATGDYQAALGALGQVHNSRRRRV